MNIQATNNIAPINYLTEMALLGFIYHEPAHGYEIYQRLVNTPELWLIWRIKQSRLYAMLDRLERDGLLETELVISHDGRPPRKMLRPSPAGRAAFEQWLAEPVALPRDIRLAFLLKLYFANQVGPQQAKQLLHNQLALSQSWLTSQRERLDESLPPTMPFSQMVNTFRYGQMSAMVDWLEGCVKELS